MTQNYQTQFLEQRRFLSALTTAADPEVRTAAQREIAALDAEARVYSHPPPGPSMTAKHRQQHLEQRAHLRGLIATGDTRVVELARRELSRIDNEAREIYGFTLATPPNLRSANANSRPAAPRPANSDRHAPTVQPGTAHAGRNSFDQRLDSYLRARRAGGEPVWGLVAAAVR